MSYARIHNKGGYHQEEYTAHAVITPGNLVKLNSDGEVLRHSTSGGQGEAMIAMEDALQGNTVDDNYAAADLVTVILPYKGSVVNALILAGENVAIGDHLYSSGAGCLKKVTDAATQITLFVAVENCDLSGSGAANTLCAVRAI